eukprot:2890275-Karenia_brevis.AAC.1
MAPKVMRSLPRTKTSHRPSSTLTTWQLADSSHATARQQRARMARETRIGMKDFNYSILSGLTHLERLSIHEPTIRDYQQRLDIFLAWICQSCITVNT